MNEDYDTIKKVLVKDLKKGLIQVKENFIKKKLNTTDLELLHSKLIIIEKDNIRGTISYEDYTVNRLKILEGVLKLINEIEENSQDISIDVGISGEYVMSYFEMDTKMTGIIEEGRMFYTLKIQKLFSKLDMSFFYSKKRIQEIAGKISFLTNQSKINTKYIKDCIYILDSTLDRLNISLNRFLFEINELHSKGHFLKDQENVITIKRMHTVIYSITEEFKLNLSIPIFKKQGEKYLTIEQIKKTNILIQIQKKYLLKFIRFLNY